MAKDWAAKLIPMVQTYEFHGGILRVNGEIVPIPKQTPPILRSDLQPTPKKDRILKDHSPGKILDEVEIKGKVVEKTYENGILRKPRKGHKKRKHAKVQLIKPERPKSFGAIMHDRSKYRLAHPTKAELEAAKLLVLLGYEFRREVVIGFYIADFVLPGKNILEIDGSFHDGREDYDQRRDAWLRGRNWSVIRVINEQVMVKNAEQVLAEALDKVPKKFHPR